MEQTTINEQARQYVQGREIGGVMAKAAAQQAFMDGAKWRINAAWHTSDEDPQTEPLDLLLVENHGEYYLEPNTYTPAEDDRWAYLGDLLPDSKEGGRR